MATEIDDSGSHGYDAPLTGTFTTDAANKVLEMGSDGSADTGFTLPTDSDWLLVEVYDINGTAGHIGFTKWQSDSLGNMGTDVDTVLSGYYTTINAEYGDSTNTFKAIATLFDTSASTATVMEADDTAGFDTVASPSYTKTSYTPPTGTWKITDTLVAPSNIVELVANPNFTLNIDGVDDSGLAVASWQDTGTGAWRTTAAGGERDTWYEVSGLTIDEEYIGDGVLEGYNNLNCYLSLRDSVNVSFGNIIDGGAYVGSVTFTATETSVFFKNRSGGTNGQYMDIDSITLKRT